MKEKKKSTAKISVQRNIAYNGSQMEHLGNSIILIY